MNNNLKIGDWVMICHSDLTPYDIDASSWFGIPGIVKEIKDNDRILIYSPLKVCWGRPPIDEVPLCQLIRINGKDGDKYVKSVLSCTNNKTSPTLEKSTKS